MFPLRRTPFMRYLILLFGVFACATSVLFIRSSTTDPVLLSAYRLILGAAFLTPAYRRAARVHPDFRLRWKAPEVWLPALLLASHFISWIYGARLTPAANATLLVNMTPVMMPVLLWMIVREMISLPEGVGSFIAIAGVSILVGSDLQFSGERVLGDLVCFGSMILYAAYLAFARRNRAIPSIYLYVVPLYAMAGVICLAVGTLQWGFNREMCLIGPDLSAEFIAIFGLALVPTVVGHSLVNWAFKHIRPQAVSTINLAQAIFASLMAAVLFREFPGPELYIAAALILGGTLIVVRTDRKTL